MNNGSMGTEEGEESNSNFLFYCQLKDLLDKHYVPREAFNKLQGDYLVLKEEYERSRAIFKKKLQEWDKIKEFLKNHDIPKAATDQVIPELRAHDNEQIDECHEKITIKAPRVNKASRRLLYGGNTPPGYWSTKFTPDK
jgi:hypothetical protein